MYLIVPRDADIVDSVPSLPSPEVLAGSCPRDFVHSTLGGAMRSTQCNIARDSVVIIIFFYAIACEHVLSF